MLNISMMDESQKSSPLRMISFALLAGFGGLPTAFLIVLAVVVGHRLDQSFPTRGPIFLLAFLGLAVPFGLLSMIIIARVAARATGTQLQSPDTPVGQPDRDEEDDT